jgi:hypothetical protein
MPAARTATGRLLDDVVQQRRLAHAWFATHHQDPALSRADSVDEPVEHVAFPAPARELRRASRERRKRGHTRCYLPANRPRRLASGGCETRPAASPSPSMTQGGPPLSTTQAPDRYTALPDDQTLASAVVALEEHGFSVEVVDDLDAARRAVLARIPNGSSVMTNTSVTLQETGIADAINDGGPYESARTRMMALDFATQAQEMKAIGDQPDYALGSVHAVTRDGTLVIASASGSQLASYAWGAANVIFVVGAQKLVPTLEAAHERIYQHSLPLEDARAIAAYGQNSFVGKILEIHQELPGRIHIVLIRQSVGF